MSDEVLLVGGPRDETLFAAGDAALVIVEDGGLVHRYIRTTQEREWDGRTLTAYTYDGVVDPSGAQSGVETR